MDYLELLFMIPTVVGFLILAVVAYYSIQFTHGRMLITLILGWIYLSHTLTTCAAILGMMLLTEGFVLAFNEWNEKRKNEPKMSKLTKEQQIELENFGKKMREQQKALNLYAKNSM